MKSKLRKITVREITYLWNVKQIDPNYICLRVWANGVKSYPWFQLRYRFDDPWLNFGEIFSAGERGRGVFKSIPVTPQHVVEAINQVITEYGHPEQGFITLNFSASETKKLVVVENALLSGGNPFDRN